MSINLPCNTFIVATIALTILKNRNKLCGEFLRGTYRAKLWRGELNCCRVPTTKRSKIVRETSRYVMLSEAKRSRNFPRKGTL